MPATRSLIVGNWKMFGLGPNIDDARKVAASLETDPVQSRVAICAPATLVERLARALEGSAVIVGGQDIHHEDFGAYTGDISGHMLAEAGARMVILGHSERRAAYRENNALVAAKTRAALHSGLEPIICVGESMADRQLGRTLAVISKELTESLTTELAGTRFAVAYEPLWAVGTGRTPTVEQIEEAHGALRNALGNALGEQARAMPILYGGSVKPENAAAILKAKDVNGALIGGASLKADDFLAIVRAAG
jgi:triosephosphate isomerase